MANTAGNKSTAASLTGPGYKKTERSQVVQSLTELLKRGHAHATFEEAVKGVPAKSRGTKHGGLPYSIWQLAEHIRIAQWDILEFSRNADYESPVWPDGYWPDASTPPDETAWKNTVKSVLNDRREFIDLLKDPGNDLYEPFPYGDGQNLIREALLIADHTAYHTGQIILVRKILKIW